MIGFVNSHKIYRAIPYEGKETYIFVSYCHKDKEKVYPMLELLARAGYRLWYDAGNHAGDNWVLNIENHLEDSTVVIAFISENASLSHNCKSEITYAFKCRKKVVPVLIDDSDLPKGFRMQLSNDHLYAWSDFSSDEALLAKIAEIEECKVCKSSDGMIKEREPIKVTPVRVNKKRRKAVGEVKPLDVVKEVIEEKSKKLDKPISTEIQNVDLLEPQEIATQILKRETESPDIQKKLKEQGVTVCANSIDDNIITICVPRINVAVLIQLGAKRVYTLRLPQTKIGRSPVKCDIVIEGNDSISRYHADIIQHNGNFFLRDANSENGSFVNGEQLEAGGQKLLDNPSIFHLNDEAFILISGDLANSLIKEKAVSLVLNSTCSAFRLVGKAPLLLNRNNAWSDGTLSDRKVHRVAHAQIKQESNGIYLIDESPDGGNGTHLNDNRLMCGESRLLASGDHIRLGDTTLNFMSIKI